MINWSSLIAVDLVSNCTMYHSTEQKLERIKRNQMKSNYSILGLRITLTMTHWMSKIELCQAHTLQLPTLWLFPNHNRNRSSVAQSLCICNFFFVYLALDFLYSWCKNKARELKLESEFRTKKNKKKMSKSHWNERKNQLPRARLPKRPKRSCSIYLLCT